MSDIKISWALPTKREPVATGVALPVSEIAHSFVEIMRPGTTTYVSLATILAAAAETTMVLATPPGVYSFRVTVADTGGRRSTPVITSVTVPAAVVNPPGPATGLTAVVV